MAREVLGKLNLTTPEETEIICSAIYHHDDKLVVDTPTDEALKDWFNIDLTGITPEAVMDAPTFPELWRELEPMMSSGLLIAHNAPFDMSVLAKCLLDYGILWRPTAHYACTCQMGRRLLPELPNHKLDTLCDYLDLELDHHHAGSDSRVCAEILLYYLDGGADIRRHIRTYDLLRVCTLKQYRR